MAAAAQPIRQRHQRIFRARKDVLNELDDGELIKRYRLDRAGIIFVTDLVQEKLTSATARNKALSPEMKICRCKNYTNIR